MRIMKIKGFIMMISMLSTGLTSIAQDKWTLKSEYLGCDVPALVFKPRNYDSNQKYPLVYLLHGYSADYTQWSKTIDCENLATKYNTIIVCPEGFTFYYVDSQTSEKHQYESFFFKELVPEVHKVLNVDGKNVFISGLSMGGYGALRYLIRHPDYFKSAGSTSGAIDINFNLFSDVSRLFWQSNRMTDDLYLMLGDPKETDWSKYSIVRLLEDNPDFSRTFIFDCGTEDILYESSSQLKEYVDKNKIPAVFISQHGEHNTEYWEKSIEYHFIFFQQQY